MASASHRGSRINNVPVSRRIPLYCCEKRKYAQNSGKKSRKNKVGFNLTFLEKECIIIENDLKH